MTDKLHSNNELKVFSEEYKFCKCGNRRGVRKTICTVYDNKGIKSTSVAKEEVVCPFCKNQNFLL